MVGCGGAKNFEVGHSLNIFVSGVLCCAEKEVLAALGEDPERAPWKSWASLREQVIERQLAKQFIPTAFVQNRVSCSATQCLLAQRHGFVRYM